MGCFYGLSKVYLIRDSFGKALIAASMSVITPTVMHGVNNFLINMSMIRLSIIFDILIFVASLTTATIIAHKTAYDEDIRVIRP
jgi:hypothetical protein